jgi:hypothetical protein
MRNFILALAFILMGCALRGEKVQYKPDVECDYRNLADVIAKPQKSNGKYLCAKLFSYSRHGFFGFYDQPIASNTEGLNSNALLIGEEDAVRNFGRDYPKDGKSVWVRGIIDLQLSCYQKKNSCVPISRPIYLRSPTLRIGEFDK